MRDDGNEERDDESVEGIHEDDDVEWCEDIVWW